MKNEINEKRNVVRIEIKGYVIILAYTKKLISWFCCLHFCVVCGVKSDETLSKGDEKIWGVIWWDEMRWGKMEI